MDIQHVSRNLHNEDLAPVVDRAPAVDRKRGASSLFNVRTPDVHSPWSHYLAASLLLLCGGFLNFIVARGIGGLLSNSLPYFSNVLPPWWSLYGWFLDLTIAGIFYFVLVTTVRKTVPQIA